jgi:hypothetical protein
VRPIMGAPDYVYTPRTPESIAKQRASLMRRLGIPDGFRRVYGVHVAEAIAPELRKYAADIARRHGFSAAHHFVLYHLRLAA